MPFIIGMWKTFPGKVSAQWVKMSACAQGRFCTRARWLIKRCIRAQSAIAEQKMRSLPTLYLRNLVQFSLVVIALANSKSHLDDFVWLKFHNIFKYLISQKASWKNRKLFSQTELVLLLRSECRLAISMLWGQNLNSGETKISFSVSSLITQRCSSVNYIWDEKYCRTN